MFNFSNPLISALTCNIRRSQHVPPFFLRYLQSMLVFSIDTTPSMHGSYPWPRLSIYIQVLESRGFGHWPVFKIIPTAHTKLTWGFPPFVWYTSAGFLSQPRRFCDSKAMDPASYTLTRSPVSLSVTLGVLSPFLPPCYPFQPIPDILIFS